MVLRAAAQLLECRMGCPMRNAASCLLFNLSMRERERERGRGRERAREESHCRNINVVTKEYCCVM
jgi:hypothetical protein